MRPNVRPRPKNTKRGHVRAEHLAGLARVFQGFDFFGARWGIQRAGITHGSATKVVGEYDSLTNDVRLLADRYLAADGDGRR